MEEPTPPTEPTTPPPTEPTTPPPTEPQTPPTPPTPPPAPAVKPEPIPPTQSTTQMHNEVLEKDNLFSEPETEINECGNCEAKFQGTPKYCPSCGCQFSE